MKLYYTFALAAVVLFTALSPVVAQTGFPDNFTATVMTEGYAVPMASMGPKTKVENIGGPGIAQINHADTKRSITLSSVTKTYYEGKIDDRQPTVYDKDVVVDKKKVGTETIDGHPCIKYDVVYYRKSSPQEKHRGTIWEAQDLKNFPIRSEMMLPKDPAYQGKEKVVTLFKDVKLGAAKASMFEVPKDYRKVNSPAEVFGAGGGANMEEMMKKAQQTKPSKGAR